MGDVHARHDQSARQKVDQFLVGLAGVLAAKTDIALLFGGRQGTLAERVLFSLEKVIGPDMLDQRASTYIPTRHSEAELPEADYVRYGVVVYVGEFPEQRREALVRDADVVLVMGTGRGISEMAKIAAKLARFVIPVPFIDGPAVDLFAKQFRRPSQHRLLRENLASLGGNSSDGLQCANAVGRVLDLFVSGEVGRSQVFLAMPFVPEFVERSQVEKIAREVCERHGLSLYIAKDTLADKPLIAEILEQIDASAVLIAYLDCSRPNVYLETGYAWGQEKPTVLCIKQGDSPAFDVSAFEQIRWATTSELRKGLDKRITQLVRERVAISAMGGK